MDHRKPKSLICENVSVALTAACSPTVACLVPVGGQYPEVAGPRSLPALEGDRVLVPAASYLLRGARFQLFFSLRGVRLLCAHAQVSNLCSTLAYHHKASADGLLIWSSMKELSYVLKNERFSDVDVVIKLAAHGGGSHNTHAGGPIAASMPDLDGSDASKRADDDTGLIELSVFPGHRMILCRSDYFDAQDLFNLKNGADPVTGSRPILSVVVDDASHVPAVEAIIAMLYGVKGSIAELQEHQWLHVVKYADMLQLNVVAQQAVQLLVTAESTKQGLSDDTLDILHHITWPDCLLPLLSALVESVGSNLELIWKHKQLSKKLLKLPLPATRLLLSSDQLQIYSEDTVLYTAARYVTAQPDEQQPEACKQLSALIRAPHLSDFQLTAQAVSKDETAISIMQLHQPLLQKLLAIKRLDPVIGSEVASWLPSAPESWQLPARKILPTNVYGVELLWQVPVSELMSAYNSCRETKRTANLFSESVTAPVSGIAWQLQLQCIWHVAGKGVRIGVYSMSAWCPEGVVCKQQFKIEGPGVTNTSSSSAHFATKGWGWEDFFDIGTLQGPLDQSAWVSKGLPTMGSIELKLTVYKVL